MNFEDLKNELKEVEDFLKQEYLQISTGRANPSLLDSVKVESYGSLQSIKNIASINVDDARTLRVSPWDKSQIKEIEKAILESKLPFSVSTNENSVLVTIPQLTEEGKKKIVKLVKEKLEQARVRVRTIRQEWMKRVDFLEGFSEDDLERFRKEIQKQIDEVNKRLEDLFKKKEEDILSV